MTLKELKEPLEGIRLKHERRTFKRNPIRTIKYPDSKRSFLRDESCHSNVIGRDSDKILGMFCYDAE